MPDPETIEHLMESAKVLKWVEENSVYLYYQESARDGAKKGWYVRTERMPNWEGHDQRFNSLRNAALFTMSEDEKAMEKTCKNCVHWIPDGRGAGGYGRCECIPATGYIGSRDELAIMKVADRNHEGDTQLRTRAEFGCLRWEKKED